MKTKSIIVLAVAVVTVSSLVAFKSANSTAKPVAQKEIAPNSGGFALKD
jgi:hypothetical protein